MQNKTISLYLFSIITLIGISASLVYAQEPSHATFQESAQIIIDNSISKNVTASITLQSTSIQEIRIPAELEQKIRQDKRIDALVLTNQEQCVLGVVDQSCIMINVKRDPADKGIIAIQSSTKNITDSYIDEINQAFDTDAKFHSVFIHTDDKSNKALETSGVISGRGVISAVYTMTMEDTSSMYEKISTILLPKIIRDGGGFYSVAKDLSSKQNTKMTFSLIPLDSASLLQLKLSIDHPNKASVTEINPLEFLHVDDLKRSSYFSNGFYPLNSILQTVVLSPNVTSVSDIQGRFVPTQTIDNEKLPTDLYVNGWIFDPIEGELIQGKYLFGKQASVSKNDLQFSLGESPATIPPNNTAADLNLESVVILGIITAVAVAAAIFYLKGYRK